MRTNRKTKKTEHKKEHSIMLDDKQSTDESQVDNDSHGSSSHHAVLSRNRLRNNEVTKKLTLIHVTQNYIFIR